MSRLPAAITGAILSATSLLLVPSPLVAQTAADLLSQYIQIDSSNPPGGEDATAAFLAEQLHRVGIETRLLVSPGGRTSLYARLDGGPRARGSVVFMHHMDVVPPGPGWSVPPFSGARRNGFLWGRGAVDDKSLGIAHLEAFLDLAETRPELAHDVIYLAVADEETGGREGAEWILENHGELFEDTLAVLTEGGSNRVFNGNTIWWGVEVAQKRPLWLEVSTRGKAGHGSRIDLHTAPNKLLRALVRLLDLPREYRITDEARAYFSHIDRLAPDGGGWLEGAQRAMQEGRIEAFLRPGQHNLFLDTIQITQLDSGHQVNAIPDRAMARIDVRTLPDTDQRALLAKIQETLGGAVEVKVLLDAPRADPSPTDNPLYACLERVLGREAPVVPTFMAGVTDARYFRQRGIPVYGFSPFESSIDEAHGVHAADERLSEKVFARGVETMTDLVGQCVGAE